jgi:TorA maturation chaperone TorD
MMSLNESSRLENIALAGRILGTLFSHEPDHESAAPFVSLLAQRDGLSEWPVDHPDLPAIADRFAAGYAFEPEPLPVAWQRLFIGPHALPAPPWGSVYLDKEQVLFGESTTQLRRWMQEKGIACQHAAREPEDSMGLMLKLAAWLAEQGQAQALDELLAWHFMPWAGRFLELFVQHAQHPFYQALGELTQITLADWRSGLLIPVGQKVLFR